MTVLIIGIIICFAFIVFITRCKHEWKVAGWTYVKCKKCGYIKSSKKEATKLINERISHMPPECEPWKVKERL